GDAEQGRRGRGKPRGGVAVVQPRRGAGGTGGADAARRPLRRRPRHRTRPRRRPAVVRQGGGAGPDRGGGQAVAPAAGDRPLSLKGRGRASSYAAAAPVLT